MYEDNRMDVFYVSPEEQQADAMEYEARMSQFSNYPQLVVHNYGREGMTSDATVCICHGTGWWYSPYDSMHTCSYHYNGQMDPESQGDREQHQYATEAEWRASSDYLQEIEWEMERFVRRMFVWETYGSNNT